MRSQEMANSSECILCGAEIPWFETFREDGTRIYLCGYCQEKAKTREIMKRRKSYRAKNKKRRNVGWGEDDEQERA